MTEENSITAAAGATLYQAAVKGLKNLARIVSTVELWRELRKENLISPQTKISALRNRLYKTVARRKHCAISSPAPGLWMYVNNGED